MKTIVTDTEGRRYDLLDAAMISSSDGLLALRCDLHSTLRRVDYKTADGIPFFQGYCWGVAVRVRKFKDSGKAFLGIGCRKFTNGEAKKIKAWALGK